MLRRMYVLFLLIAVLTSMAIAGDKKKKVLAPCVLEARTVLVLIDPNAGMSADAPLANKTAQEDVEKALTKWGRWELVVGTQAADLIITVRKGTGKLVQPTIGGVPQNDRPVMVQSTSGTIRVGGQQGHDPGIQQNGPAEAGPHPQMEVGAADDMMVIYQGGDVERPLEQAAVWRYQASGALRSPDVPAVDRLRKDIEEAEKQQKSKP